jgi:demethylmenaquinone methyltransferase / 2-methoxy-6-polyprenyl-1,4-benzoquinol methylase
LDFDVGIVGSLLYIHFQSFSLKQSMIPRISTVTHPSMSVSLPEGESTKQEYVRSLFDGIAPHYDFLNHFLSSGFDILWRKRAIRLLREFHPQHILDVATGTADLAIEAARSLGADVIGIDISNQMLALGRKKILSKGVTHLVSLKPGDAESLDFEGGVFDAVTVAFGVRNFSDVRRGLGEMLRVLKPRGIAMILEFSKPRTFPMSWLYNVYFHWVLPVLGGLISKSRESYEYLPKSVRDFPDDKAFLELLHSVGYSNTAQYRLTFGIATIYLGTKPGL